MIRRCSFFSSNALYLISSTCKLPVWLFSFTSLTFKFWTRFFECCFLSFVCFVYSLLFFVVVVTSAHFALFFLFLCNISVYFFCRCCCCCCRQPRRCFCCWKEQKSILIYCCLAVFPIYMRFCPHEPLFRPLLKHIVCAHTSSSRMRFIWEHV